MSNYVDLGGGPHSYITEHYLKRVLAGNIESVRRRLIATLERLGYSVIEEEPVLLGRRGAKGWGTWGGSTDVLDYAMTLAIRMKPISGHATSVTFEYLVKHPWLSHREKEVLTREAEAITALASVRAADKVCAACGIESTGDSRFCRRCGTPMTSEQAELDVLRMTAEAKAGHTSVVTSSIMLMSTNLIALVALIVAGFAPIGAKILWGSTIIAVIIGFLNLLVSLCAWKRINLALKSKGEEHRKPPASMDLERPTIETFDFPPQRAETSITEGTTDLLSMQDHKHEILLTNQDNRDTGRID